MAKYKPCNNEQMVMLPISLENQFQPGTLEHTIHEVVEKHIDTSVFDARYRNDDSLAVSVGDGGGAAAEPDRRDESEDRQRSGAENLRPAVGDCGAGLCERLRPEKNEPIRG